VLTMDKPYALFRDPHPPRAERRPLHCDCVGDHIPDVCGLFAEKPRSNTPDGTVRDTVYGAIVVAVLSALLAIGLFGWITAEAATPDRVFANGFESGSAGGPPPDFCDHPLVRPAGFAPKLITWRILFTPRDGNPKPTYPDSLGFPVPIGAEKGTFTAAMFTAEADQTVSMFWDPAQAKPSEGYMKARPAVGMFISISPCPGDLRPADNSGGFLMAGCRKYANAGSLIWSTRITQSTISACAVQDGEKYFITVAPYNAAAGPLHPDAHTCSPTSSSEYGCDVQARQQD
jgi:hypothetical protein